MEKKTMNRKELCHYYGISYYILRKWLELIEEELGTCTGYSFSPRQVEIIMEHYGRKD